MVGPQIKTEQLLTGQRQSDGMHSVRTLTGGQPLWPHLPWDGFPKRLGQAPPSIHRGHDRDLDLSHSSSDYMV